MEDREELNYFLAFNALINFTHNRYKILKSKFISLKKAFYANREDFLSLGFNVDFVDRFIKNRSSFSLDLFLQKNKEEGINFCTIEDNFYPSLLLNIFNPPPVLYYKGDICFDWEKSLSVVGSRKFSSYGEKIIKDFVVPLARNNLSIISGMALGLDSLAHKASIDNNSRTLAVLGSGLDFHSIYPRDNMDLFNKIIASGGCVCSEFPFGSKALAYNFPQRNRIIAGLSRASLIIEAGKKSGSLITAKIAMEEGRDVLVFPGSVYDEAVSGNNMLIKNGANPVLSVSDILDFFNLSIQEDSDFFSKNIEKKAKNEEELLILNFLKNKNASIEEISLALNIDLVKLSSVLSFLEIRSLVKNLGFQNYQLIQ